MCKFDKKVLLELPCNKKVADNIGSLTHGQSRGAESTSDVSTTKYSIADLRGFVKQIFTKTKEDRGHQDASPANEESGSLRRSVTYGIS